MSNINDASRPPPRIVRHRNREAYPPPSKIRDKKHAKERISVVSAGLTRLDDFKLYYMDAITDWEANS